jgi:hypothetical protein
LVPFDAARLRPVGSFGSILNIHIYSIEMIYNIYYIYTYTLFIIFPIETKNLTN